VPTVTGLPAVRFLPGSRLADRALAILAIGAALAFAYVVRALIAPHGAWAALSQRFLHLRAQTQQLAAPHQPGAVRVEENLPWATLLVGTAQGALALAGAATVAVFVLYFALAEGPRFREKLLAGSLFFFWLWGPVGLFVAVPVLSTVRIACKYVPRLGAIADFLAE
jgi:predicted PurR-regulated permease PerM